MIPLMLMTIVFMYTDIVLMDGTSFIKSVQHNLFFCDLFDDLYHYYWFLCLLSY